MPKKIIDLALLTLDTMALNFTHLAPVLFPYTLSLIHSKNPNFLSADLFASNLAFYTGKTIGTYFINWTILKLGFKKMMFLASILYLTSILLIRSTCTVFTIFISKGL